MWLLVAMHGYGIGVLTQPWNPYLPLVAWTVVLLATWMTLEGDHRMLIPLVVAGLAVRADPRAVPVALRRACSLLPRA